MNSEKNYFPGLREVQNTKQTDNETETVTTFFITQQKKTVFLSQT